MVTARIRDMILDWHDKGISVDETANVLKLPENQIIDIIKTGHPTKPADTPHPEPPAFDIWPTTNRQPRTPATMPARAG